MSGAFNQAPRNFVMDSPKTLSPVSGMLSAVNPTTLCMLKKDLSGALVAATFKQIMSLTGPGVMSFLALTSEDDNATLGRTLSVQVVVDGVTVVNKSAFMSAGFGYGIVAIGGGYGGAMVMQPLAFLKSCVVSIKSDYTETNKSILLSSYRLC